MTGESTLISGEQALAEFRQGLTGAHAFQLLKDGKGRLLIRLPVGVGKTAWLAKIVRYAVSNDLADPVIVLVPRWDILRELRKLLRTRPRPVVLTPRPRKRCGELDEKWMQLEQASCGQLGRETLCKACPNRSRCSWPDQYRDRLAGKRILLGTQQHLRVNASFVRQLIGRTGGHNPLVIIDESNLLLSPAERILDREDLDRFVDVLQKLVLKPTIPTTLIEATKRWLTQLELLLHAPTSDLRTPDWQFPAVGSRWALEVQRLGSTLFPQGFSFLAYDLEQFGRGDLSCRERLDDGSIRFTCLPDLGRRFLIFSGSMAGALARFRLDPNHERLGLYSPFEGYRFKHPGTRFYNIRSSEATARHFPGNASRILNFFAQLLLRNLHAGRRTLLVARKKFVRTCRRRLLAILAGHGVSTLRIVTGNWSRHDLSNPQVVPLISYGLAGINRFQTYEAVYCLTGYYVSPQTVEQMAQDIEPRGDRFPITLTVEGNPPRRTTKVTLPDQRTPLLPWLAEAILDQVEADVILQAVGRVRPFTEPREVITSYLGDLPGVVYARDFRTLSEALAHFNIPNPQQALIASRAGKARERKSQGVTHKLIAEELGVSVSTVKRYLKRR